MLPVPTPFDFHHRSIILIVPFSTTAAGRHSTQLACLAAIKCYRFFPPRLVSDHFWPECSECNSLQRPRRTRFAFLGDPYWMEIVGSSSKKKKKDEERYECN